MNQNEMKLDIPLDEIRTYEEEVTGWWLGAAVGLCSDFKRESARPDSYSPFFLLSFI